MSRKWHRVPKQKYHQNLCKFYSIAVSIVIESFYCLFFSLPLCVILFSDSEWCCLPIQFRQNRFLPPLSSSLELPTFFSSSSSSSSSSAASVTGNVIYDDVCVYIIHVVPHQPIFWAPSNQTWGKREAAVHARSSYIDHDCWMLLGRRRKKWRKNKRPRKGRGQRSEVVAIQQSTKPAQNIKKGLELISANSVHKACNNSNMTLFRPPCSGKREATAALACRNAAAQKCACTYVPTSTHHDDVPTHISSCCWFLRTNVSIL